MVSQVTIKVLEATFAYSLLEGIRLITMKARPTLKYGIITISEGLMGVFASASHKYRWSITVLLRRTATVKGFMITLSSNKTFAFLISTISPMETCALYLVRRSILIIPLFSSSSWRGLPIILRSTSRRQCSNS